MEYKRMVCLSTLVLHQEGLTYSYRMEVLPQGGGYAGA